MNTCSPFLTSIAQLSRSSILRFCALAISLLALASCGGGKLGGGPYAPTVAYMSGIGNVPTTPNSSGTLPDNISYWEGDNIPGEASVVINLSTQKASFYKGGQLVGVSAVSTGKEGHNTPAGNYKILEKIVDKYSNLYGSIVDDTTGQVINDDATPRTPVPPGASYKPAPMPHWMRLTNGGVGMHAGYLPGYAASHGCIRMPAHMAETFHQHVKVGTPVKVVY